VRYNPALPAGTIAWTCAIRWRIHQALTEDDMTDPIPDDVQPVSQFKSKSGIKRIFGAISYSIEGFKTAWRIEHAFRQELVLVAFATLIALMLPVSAFEKLLLIGVFILVLIVELLNSAIEAVVDRVSLERNPLSKNAKDFGSAAVFLTLCLAAATWGVIVIPLL
jgi:diacylglycerol kinase (ATP)